MLAPKVSFVTPRIEAILSHVLTHSRCLQPARHARTSKTANTRVHFAFPAHAVDSGSEKVLVATEYYHIPKSSIPLGDGFSASIIYQILSLFIYFSVRALPSAVARFEPLTRCLVLVARCGLLRDALSTVSNAKKCSRRNYNDTEACEIQPKKRRHSRSGEPTSAPLYRTRHTHTTPRRARQSRAAAAASHPSPPQHSAHAFLVGICVPNSRSFIFLSLFFLIQCLAHAAGIH